MKKEITVHIIIVSILVSASQYRNTLCINRLSQFSQQLIEGDVVNIIHGPERLINMPKITQLREWQRQDTNPDISDFRVCALNLHKLSL